MILKDLRRKREERVMRVPAVLLCGVIFSTLACNSTADREEALRAEVAAALDGLVAELLDDPPADVAVYGERLRMYLESHPEFYGAAVALLDENGAVTASPYVHRILDGYRTLDLAQADYDAEKQDWITMPLAARMDVWTPPYFDEGGGEAWMITRSAPMFDGDRVFAIVTTDLQIEADTAYRFD